MDKTAIEIRLREESKSYISQEFMTYMKHFLQIQSKYKYKK